MLVVVVVVVGIRLGVVVLWGGMVGGWWSCRWRSRWLVVVVVRGGNLGEILGEVLESFWVPERGVWKA